MNTGARTRTRILSFGIGLALAALAACGGGSAAAKVEDELGLSPEGIIARQTKIESAIRDCMKAQGFDYVPVDPVAQRNSLTGQTGLNEGEFEKTYGYGITTLYEQRLSIAADPNTAIKNRLSATDQVSYSKALSGEFSDATFAVAADTGDYSKLGGCTRQATEAAFGGADLLTTIVAKLDELDQRVVTDRRMQQAIAKWSDCMRAAGYDLPEPEQVDVVLGKRLDAIAGPANDRHKDYDKAALTALQRDEVAMVASDKQCETKHITKVEDAVRAEYEKAFREQNAALLGKVTKP